MSLFHPPSPLAPDLGRGTTLRAWTLVVAVAAGVVVVGLALAGRLSPEPAAATVLAVAAVTGLVWVTANPLVRVVRAEPVADARADALPAEALAELADGLPDPVLMISGQDRDDYAGRRILFANRAARELLHVPAETALLVAAIRNPEVLEVVDEALFGGIEGQAKYEAGGVQERFWRAVAKPLSPGPDGARRALLSLSDETDARRNERMRADFLANASHELRTPLASLAGFIDTLRGHAKDDPVARERFLGIMGAQAWRMARLIEDLMSLSRIELNEHIRPSDEVDVVLTVQDVMDALAPQAREAGVAFEADLGPRGETAVIGDRDQIVQVAQNLIDNAVKYAGRGGKVRVELERGVTAEAAVTLRNPQASRLALLTPDHTGDRYAALRITDSGPGIKREHLPRLTERFYRVEGQKSGERLGTGLGLAIVKHIMNRHQGGLAVESAEGEGASFLVYFPLAHGTQQPGATPPGGAASAGAPALDTGVMKASS
jgi:two-component system, OmpR family, phosphate regulon sensor histidine kinase PhoR